MLAKDDARSALADEIEPDWPEVAFVFDAFSFTGSTEWLAGARSCPHGAIVRPSGLPERVRPDTNAREEMALRESVEIACPYIPNVPIVNISRRDMSGVN